MTLFRWLGNKAKDGGSRYRLGQPEAQTVKIRCQTMSLLLVKSSSIHCPAFNPSVEYLVLMPAVAIASAVGLQTYPTA